MNEPQIPNISIADFVTLIYAAASMEESLTEVALIECLKGSMSDPHEALLLTLRVLLDRDLHGAVLSEELMIRLFKLIKSSDKDAATLIDLGGFVDALPVV